MTDDKLEASIANNERLWAKMTDIKTYVFIILVLLVVFAYYERTTTRTITFTVTDKAFNVGTPYLIYTDDTIYTDTDSFFWWKWNSSDIYRGIEKGKKYEAFVFGWRIPYLALYPNIVSVKEITNEP